jgi:hypothetical protein
VLSVLLVLVRLLLLSSSYCASHWCWGWGKGKRSPPLRGGRLSHEKALIGYVGFDVR